MAVSRAELDAARDLFAPLGDVGHRHMMGGAMLYADGRLFGAIMGEAGLHIRGKGALAGRLAAEGATQFVWTDPGSGKAKPMGYWSLPDSALDDPEAACEWARAALEAGG